MLLAGAHDSRVVNRRARGAETGRPRASRGLCRAWGSLLQGLPPNPWPARTRWEQNRRDTSHAHGLVGLRMPPLVDFCCANHATPKKKKANRVHLLRPVLAPTGRAKPKIPCTLSKYSLLQLGKKVRA